MQQIKTIQFVRSSLNLADDASVGLASLPPLSLYIHIPWCVRKCPYCDFNSHEARTDIPERAYVDALIADLEFALPNIWGRRVQTIFFGGGTPSLFSAASLDRLLSAIRARVNVVPDAEITLEANPGTFEAEKFVAYRKLGINRLSIGIQSFNSQHLTALGRIHDANEARRAVAIAKDNFDNFNLDLMYALPKQNLPEALADIEQALSFGAPHVSAYHLTLEPNTLFYKNPPSLPDHDASATMQEAIEVRLADAGYEHYETSAFAKPGHACKHNLNYWQFGDYLGIGAGAHSKLSFRERIVREMRYKHPSTYLQNVAAGNAVQENHTIGAADLPFEFMMNALRLTDGVPLALFPERTGLPINVVSKVLAKAEAKQLMTRDQQRLAPTQTGQRFLNDLLEMFLPEQ
jgi:putative oxygen-independent coproporphyrinogen III oxidase